MCLPCKCNVCVHLSRWIKAGSREGGDTLEAVTSAILGQEVMQAAGRDPPFTSGGLHEPFPPAVGGSGAAPFKVSSGRGSSSDGRRRGLGSGYVRGFALRRAACMSVVAVFGAVSLVLTTRETLCPCLQELCDRGLVLGPCLLL